MTQNLDRFLTANKKPMFHRFYCKLNIFLNLTFHKQWDILFPLVWPFSTAFHFITPFKFVSQEISTGM